MVAVELVNQTDDAQQKRQEIIGVASAVFGHFARQILLRSEIHPVDEVDAGEPIAVGYGNIRCLYVILAAYKIPKEIPPIHIIQLVREEIVDILGKCRLYNRAGLFAVVINHLAAIVEYLPTNRPILLVADDFAVVVADKIHLRAVCSPRFVVALALHVVPHTREEVHELRRIGVFIDFGTFHIFARTLVEMVERLLGITLDGSGI